MSAGGQSTVAAPAEAGPAAEPATTESTPAPVAGVEPQEPAATIENPAGETKAEGAPEVSKPEETTTTTTEETNTSKEGEEKEA